MAEIASERAVDPDAQAAVTDFLDYTEYLPSDLIRSLTLIRGLDQTYQADAHALNDLTQLYGTLPALEPALRPNGQKLRSQISTHLDQALKARESAYAEACRLFDVADRHQNRLKSIIAKLSAIPKPPSRDPTPAPTPASAIKRSRSGRKIEPATTRLTIHPPRGGAVASAILKRPRGRRVTVPGDVMPPFDPDSPIASTEVSDWGSPSPPPSPPRPILKLKQPKPPAPPKAPKQRPAAEEKARAAREATEPYHKPTPPPEDAENGSEYKPWTRLTEYELYRLRKKMKKNHNWEPSDVMKDRELAERGRGWANYFSAKAEAEKNGTRFIDLDGGKAKSKTENGVRADVSDPPGSTQDTVEVVKGKLEDAAADLAEMESIIVATPAPKAKPTKKTEKKDKKPDPVRNQAALAAQEAELAARRLGDIGSQFRTLFTRPFSALASLSRSASTPNVNATRPTPARKTTEKNSKKRKAEESPSASLSPSAEPETVARKKQKTAPKPSPLAPSPVATLPTSSIAASEPPPATSAGIIKIPLKLNLTTPAPAPPSSKDPTPAPATRAASVQRASVAPKAEPSPPPPPSTTTSRPPSRRSAAASVEPFFPLSTSRSSRRASMTPSLAAAGPKTPANERASTGPSPKSVTALPTAASRRSKRDAPGTVTQSSLDGGAAVSVSKRKAKPAKKPANLAALAANANAQTAHQIRVDVDGRQEWIDEEEERYCTCGDVSYGEMICCELDEKCDFGQWFHMGCVELHELPPRTVKWFCPGDRKKFHRGEGTNGLVGRGIK